MTRARVLLYYRAPAGASRSVEDAYHRASAALRGTPGLLGNELLHDVTDGRNFAVLSDWESLDAFLAWEQGPAHRGETSPMRGYQDRGTRVGHYTVYRVAASY